jgi:pyruvate formate lyase activating enzyme
MSISMKFSGLQRTTFSDFPGKVAAIVFTKGCNFRCPFCHNPELVAGPSDAELSEADVLAFLESRRGRLGGLVVTGGEPTLHAGLAEFLASVRALGLATKLDTNGSRPDVLRRLLDEELLDFVAMDVKAPLRKYDVLAGCAVDPARVEESIRLIVASGIDHEFRTTALHRFLDDDDILEIGETVRGAQRYVLQPFVSAHTLDDSLVGQDLSFSPVELRSLSARLTGDALACSVR